MKKILAIVLTLLLFHTGIYAQQIKLSEVEKRGIADEHIKCKKIDANGVPCITITHYILRDPSVITTKSMSVDYIDQYSIENTNTIDTVQAISKITGLSVVQSGPTGQQTSVFIRGMNSNHTMVTVNGIAIKDHSTPGGLHDFGPDFIKHVTGIQVVKGSQGTLYGANAVGGVINFITTGNYSNSISVSKGSHNSQSVTFKTHKDFDNHSINIVADKTGSDGISVAPSGTENDGYDTKNFTINTNSKLDNAEFGTTIIRRDNNADLDNGTTDDLDYTTKNKFYLYQVRGKVKTNLGSSHLIFSRSEYDRDYYNGSEHDQYDSISDTFLFLNTIQKQNWDITPGIEYEKFDGSFNNRGTYNSSVDVDGENIGYFVNGNLLLSEKFTLSAGIRHDDPSLFEHYSTYRIGTTYDLNDKFLIKGNYTTSVKTPTLYELHGSDNFGYNGNPNLQPEEAKTTDIGFEYKFGNHLIDFVYFTTDLDNLITYGNSTYSNASGKSNRHGAEMRYNTFLSDKLYWRNNATFTVAQDSNDNQVTRRPKWSGFTALDWKNNNWTSTMEYSYTGSHLDIDSSTYATITKPSVGVTNFHTNYESTENSNWILSLNNVFDENYEKPDGYSQLGRNLMLTYKLKF